MREFNESLQGTIRVFDPSREFMLAGRVQTGNKYNASSRKTIEKGVQNHSLDSV
jgi:hypothetical protein